MIYPVLNKLKFYAIKHTMVNMSSIGDISLVDNRPNVKYPYVNFDVISSNIVNYSKKYLIRLYVCDRQRDPLVSYNKTELILDNILKDIDIISYSVFYFHNDFQDDCDGVYADFEFEIGLNSDCNYLSLFLDNNILMEDGSFVMMEDGSLISVEI